MGSEDYHVSRPISHRRRVRARSPHRQSSTEHIDKSACVAGAITSYSTNQVAGTSRRHHPVNETSRMVTCESPWNAKMPNGPATLVSGGIQWEAVLLEPGAKVVHDVLQAQTCSTASLRFVNVLGGQAALALMFLLHRRLHPASGISQSAFMVRIAAE